MSIEELINTEELFEENVETDELVNAEELFKKTPYEKMCENWSDREPEHPKTRVRIYAYSDTDWNDGVTLASTPFECPLCGRDDKWFIQGHKQEIELQGKMREVDVVKVFVCEHRPEDVGLVHWLPCRVVATVPPKKVSKFEIVCTEEEDQGRPRDD